MRCGQAARVRVGADGQPAEFETDVGPARLLAWLAHARVAMASGSPGVAIASCAGCGSPIAVSSREPVSLPCPHCTEPVRGPGAEVLVDQWTEPWAHVHSHALDLDYRLVQLEDARGIAAGCAACGAPSAPGNPSNRCATCGAVTWLARGSGRVQLAVRIDGIRDGKPYQVVLPIVQGEATLRADAARGTQSRSSRSLLGVTGVGCASAIALVVVLVVVVWILAHFSHC
jgi:hypothetical protein